MECLEVMMKAWTSDTPWSHKGTYWQYGDIVVEPPSVQKPHPKLWMGAGSPRSITQVADYGFDMLLGQYDSFETIVEEVNLFKSLVEAKGETFDPMRVGVARSVNIVDTKAEYDAAIDARMAGRRRTQNLAQRPDFEDTREIAELGTIYGTPDQVAEKIQDLKDAGIEYILLNCPAGIETLRRFAKEVMPAFADSAKVTA